MQIINLLRTSILGVVLIASSPALLAANIFRADTANNLNTAGAWSNSVAPTTSDVATWNNLVVGNTTSTMGGDLSWAGIQIFDPAGLITINSGSILTLGASGIDMSLANNNLTLANSNVLGASQTWNVANTRTLTVSGGIAGASTSVLTKTGNGTLVLTGVGSYSGGTVNNGGILQVGNGATGTSAGAGAITNNNGTTFRVNTTATMVNAFNFNGTVTLDLNNVGGNQGIGSPGAISGSSTVTFINQNNAAARTFTLGGSSSSMANFSGSISFGTNTGVFRFNDGGGSGNTGSSLATFDLGSGTATFFTRNRGAAVNMGALFGGPNTKITQGSSASGISTYTIGAKNIPSEFDGTISDGGASAGVAITKTGSSTLILTGPNSNVGQTTVSGGILQIGVGGAAGQLGSGAVVDNATLIYDRSDSISVANNISGTGNFVQAGPAVLSLAPSTGNAYGGATIVTNGGTVLAAAATAIPATTAVTLGGAGSAGTLDLGGNSVQVSALNTGSGATASTVGSSGGTIPTVFTVNATNGTSAFSGVIQDTLPSGGSGTLALVVQNGKLTLTGVNTYTGATTVSNGVLVVGTGGSIALSPTIVLTGSGSVLDASASGGINLQSGYVLAAGGGVAGNVTAASCLITPGTNGTVATLTCSNSLSLNGNVTVHFDLSSLPNSGNDQIVVGSALSLSGLNTIEISPLTSLSAGTYKLMTAGSVSGSGANLQLVGSPGTGLNAALSVTGSEVDLVVTTVAAPFTWVGDGSLNQWDYTTANWTSNGVASLFVDGAFVLFGNTGSHTPAVDITGPVAPATVTVDSSANYTFGSAGGTGKITGLASLTKTNSGTLILLTPNDNIGGTFINQGTVQVGNGTATGTALGNAAVINRASLVFNQPDAYDFTNVISGSGALTQSGSGTLTLSGNNTYGGTTLISAGTLQVGDGNFSGALGTNTVTDNSALAYNRSDSVVQSGKITGTGTLTVLAGTVAVTASNDFSGVTTINSGATLQLGNNTVVGSVPLANVVDNGTLAFNHPMDETNAIAITGSGGTAQFGTNTLTFTGANTYNGNTTIAAGTLKLGAAGTLPSGPGFGNVVLNGDLAAAGTLDLNGLDTVLDGINGSSNAVPGKVVNNSGTATNVLTVGAGDASTTFRGLIENNSGSGGAISLVKTGTGTFTIGWPNTYTGGTVISNGILAMGNNLANNSAGLSGVGPTNIPVVFAGGTLQLFGYNGSTSPNYNSFYNTLVVPAGQTGTLQMFSRGPASGNPGLGSPLVGAGTLNLVVNYVRGSLDGDWSAFTGTINVTPKPAGGDEFRINNRFGYANAVIFLNDAVTMDRASGANPTNDIGELGGTSGAIVGPGNSSSGSPTWRVGWKGTSANFAGTIRNDGTTTVMKVGSGIWTLSGQNTYAGTTVVSNGILALATGPNGDGSIDSSATISILPGAILDVLGRSDGTLQLGSTAAQTLQGRGSVNGMLNVAGSGMVAPGGGPGGNTGILTVSNSITLGGAVWMKVNRTNSLSSDRLVSALSTITYGGTLVVTNIGPAFQVGDTFTLFSGGGLSGGTFATLVLPAYYTWNTSQLGVNGTVTVTGVAPGPKITSVDFSTLSGGTITLNAANGAPNGQVIVFTSTNLAPPLTGWTPVTTNSFDGSGNLNLAITVDPNAPQSYYLLQAF